jgi:23S rRNA m(5)U-1939 methyltransferase (EC 2.1.1.-)
LIGTVARGWLRHLALRIGSYTGELLITLVSSTPDLEGIEILAAQWMHRWPELVGVCLNLQPLATNTLMGPEPGWWSDELGAGAVLRS